MSTPAVPRSFWRGMLVGVPFAVALWLVIYLLICAVPF